MKKILVFCTLVLFDVNSGDSVELGPSSQDVNINAVRWLAGTWKGEAFGGSVEEIWSQPAAGTMMGIFRLIKDGKVSFSEFEQIVYQDSGLVCRVKHFTSDFISWEEKDKSIEFKFLSVIGDEIHFDGLTLVRIDDKTCKQIINLTDKKTGTTKDVEIVYHRIN